LSKDCDLNHPQPSSPFTYYNFATVNKTTGMRIPICIIQTITQMDSILEKRLTAIEQQMFMNKNILSFEEASIFLNLSKSYLYKLTSGGLIPHYKPQGKMLYFEREQLENWLRQNPVRTQAQVEDEAQLYIHNHKK